jgi:hypothetical protein
MNPQLEAAWEIHQFLNSHKLRYAVIGAIALQKWGEPRLTRDVDITLDASASEAGDLVQLITQRFHSRTEDPVAFARNTRMMLVKASNGVDVDIALAFPGYEDELFRRAMDFEIEDGKAIRICSAEDLIIHKVVAGRPQDVSDVQGIVERQAEQLDAAYVRHWLKAFSEALSDPGIPDRFEQAWKRKEG